MGRLGNHPRHDLRRSWHVIAVDTNVLIYAHRRDSPFYETAYAALKDLAESGSSWAIPWPCLHEFYSIATHPRVFKPATSIADAVNQIEYWMESPAFQLIGESDDYWSCLKETVQAGKIAGPGVHDARIAAICKAHHVSVLWSADRDFSRMSGLKIVNPLLK